MPTSDPSEQRKHSRREVRIQVDLVGNRRIRALTRDLSGGGMFVEWTPPLAPGSLMPATLHLPDGPLDLTTIVVWTAPQVSLAVGAGMGMRFVTTSPEAQRRLDAFLDDDEG